MENLRENIEERKFIKRKSRRKKKVKKNKE